jgi:P27 family predicted phage terminase small subunit
MSSGRRPKPSKLRELQGNAGHRKINKHEPKPKAGIPDQPLWLTGEASAEWNCIVPGLKELGILTKVDGKALAAYCSAWAQLVQAEAAIQKYGILIVSLEEKTGVPLMKVNPAVRVKSDALRHVRAFLTEFGLTPASRSRLQIKPDDANSQDSLEDILSEDDSGEIVQ